MYLEIRNPLSEILATLEVQGRIQDSFLGGGAGESSLALLQHQ